MWIRSQDKEKLADLRVFDITGLANEYYVCGYSDDWANTNNFHINLGKYRTKEKALKVLDMIEQRLSTFTGIIKINTIVEEKVRKRIREQIKRELSEGITLLDDRFTDIPITLIFQMPQDDEV